MCDPISAGIMAGTQIIGGLLSADAASSAAAQQAAAGQQAIASQEAALAQQRALMQPFVGAGETALQRLVGGIAPGGEFAQPYQLGQALPEVGTFKAQESEAERYARDQALAAMQEQMQRGGQGLSTNAIVGAGDLAGKIASQYEQQGFNQWLAEQQIPYARRQQLLSEQQAQRQAQLSPLEYLATLGQAGASGQAANVGQTGQNIAGMQANLGNVQAMNTMQGAGALTGGIGNIGQMMFLKDLLRPSTPAGMPATGATYLPSETASPYTLATGTPSFGLRVPG